MQVSAEISRPRAAHRESRPWRAETRATLALAWPIVATNLAQMAIGTTEVVLLGWYSPQAMAAGVLGMNLFYAFMMVGIGIAAGCSPMLAQAIGRRRHGVRDLRRTVRQGLWLTTAIALIAWAVLWNTEAIFLAMGQAPAMAAGAGEYMRAMQWGMLPFFWYMVLRAFVSARERPRAALIVTVLAILLNAGLAWALIFGRLGLPELGLTGAGIAGSITETFMFAGLAGFIAFDRRFRRHYLAGRFWRPDWPRLAELCRIGGPIAGALLFEVGVFNSAVFIMGLIDVDQLAAHAIAIQIASATFMVPMGLGQATTVRVGLFTGGGERRAATRAGWTGILLGTGFMGVMAVLLITSPGPFIHIFLDTADPKTGVVAAHAAGFLAVAGLFQLVDGLQVTAAGALRGLKDTRLPMIYAGIGYWVIGLPFGAALAFWGGFQGLGIWIGLAIGLALVAILMLRRWIRRTG